MKTTLILAFTLILSTSSFAQLTPKSYVIGGGVSFRFDKTPGHVVELHTTSFSITPGIGKFTSEKYFIEGGIGYSLFARKYEEQLDIVHKTTGHSFNFTFGATRYFPLIDRLYFTVGGQITPAYVTIRNETSNFGFLSSSKSDYASTNFRLAPGLSYFINRKWMLYAHVGLLNYNITYDFEQDLVGHSLRFSAQSNSFSVGVRYVLGTGISE